MRPPLRSQLRCTTHLLPNTRKLDQSVSPLCGRTKMLQSSLGLLSDIFSPNLSNALTWNLKFLLFLIFISYHLPQPKSTQRFLIITGKLSHGEVAGTGLRCNPKVSRKLSGKVCLISTWIRALRKGRGILQGFTTAVPEADNSVPTFACLSQMAAASCCSRSCPQLVRTHSL